MYAALEAANSAGDAEMVLQIGTRTYWVDLRRKSQTNMDTGTSRTIRRAEPAEAASLRVASERSAVAAAAAVVGFNLPSAAFAGKPAAALNALISGASLQPGSRPGSSGGDGGDDRRGNSDGRSRVANTEAGEDMAAAAAAEAVPLPLRLARLTRDMETHPPGFTSTEARGVLRSSGGLRGGVGAGARCKLLGGGG